jgi:hypothetical protein
MELAGVMTAGVVYALFQQKALPESPEDWKNLALAAANNQLTPMLPYIGPVAASAIDGYSYELSVMTPVSGVVNLAKSTGDIMKSLAEGQDVNPKKIKLAIESLAESAAIVLGKPYLAPKRIVSAATDDDQSLQSWAQYLLIGGKAK